MMIIRVYHVMQQTCIEYTYMALEGDPDDGTKPHFIGRYYAPEGASEDPYDLGEAIAEGLVHLEGYAGEVAADFL